MSQSKADGQLGQLVIIIATMVFHPCRVRCVLMKVLRRNMVVLTADHPAQAS